MLTYFTFPVIKDVRWVFFVFSSPMILMEKADTINSTQNDFGKNATQLLEPGLKDMCQW